MRNLEGAWAASYLAFDVDFLERSVSSRLEEPQSFTSEQSHFALTFLKERLATTITYESCALVVGFEAEFFREEAKLDVRFVSVKNVSVNKRPEISQRTLCTCLIGRPDVLERQTCP